MRCAPCLRCGALFAAAAVLVALFSRTSAADEQLFSYDGTTLPYSLDGGFLDYNACDSDCSDHLENGHYVAQFVQGGGDQYYYHHVITQAPAVDPGSLFVEFRYRSNMVGNGNFYSSDCRLFVNVGAVSDLIYMHGDYAVNDSNNYSVTGMDATDFHLCRFQSLTPQTWTWHVDGKLLYTGSVPFTPDGYSFIQFGGHGGDIFLFPGLKDEWDFVRYGTISFGEVVQTSDPPNGYIDPRQDRPANAPSTAQGLDRFAVTFDQPNGLSVDQVTVQSTAPAALRPNVQWVTRPENEDGRTLEIRLDKRIPPGHRTRFVISDQAQAAMYGQAGASSTVEFAFLPGDVNGNEAANSQDLLAWIQAVNAGTANVLHHDINRDGVISTQDLLRLVHLLNGTNTIQPWNGVTLPPWP